jgi:hypothetical protein
LRVAPPPRSSGTSLSGLSGGALGSAEAPRRLELPFMPGRWAWGRLQISICQSAGLLLAPSTARSVIAIAVLIGAAANSSSRDHCTRTVRPGWHIAMKDASKAASSAVLWP